MLLDCCNGKPPCQTKRTLAMAIIYYVALPFVRTEEGVAPGEAQEMPNEGAAVRRAEAMSRDPTNAGALAF